MEIITSQFTEDRQYLMYSLCCYFLGIFGLGVFFFAYWVARECDKIKKSDTEEWLRSCRIEQILERK